MNIRKLLLMLSLFYSAISFAQVGVGTATPNSSTMLDVEADDKGVLLPRVQLNNSTDATTIVPQNEVGLMVYNVAAMADIGVGYHFWDGAKWVAMRTEGLTSGTGDPNGNGTTGEAGDIYVDESTGDIYVHDGNTWINSVEANETISTLTDNGDGTYTYEDEEGTQTTFDVNNPEITDNGDGTYTVTNADGTTSTIDTNATTGYVTDGTIDIDDDGTPDNNVTIQQALEALAAQASIVSTLTDNGDGTYTYEDEEGTQTTFDVNNPEITDNGDGTYTVTNADGTTSTIDTNATTGYVTDGTIDIDDDGTPDNNVTIQQALEALAAQASIVSTLTDNGDGTYTYEDEEGTQTTFDVNNPEITDNGDGTYTVTNADGTTSTIDTNATTGYVTDGTIDIDDDGTPDNNVTIQQALEALAAQASIVSTLTDNGDGTYTYEDEEGTQTTFDVNNPEITDNGDGTYTVTNADGTTSTIDTNATTGYVTDGTIDIDDDGTPDNNVTIQQALEALAAQASIVSTLTDNGDGTYTYEDEEGTQTTFDVNNPEITD